MQSPNCSPQHASYLSQSTDDLVLPWLGPEALEPDAARPAQMMPTTHASQPTRVPGASDGRARLVFPPGHCIARTRADRLHRALVLGQLPRGTWGPPPRPWPRVPWPRPAPTVGSLTFPWGDAMRICDISTVAKVTREPPFSRPPLPHCQPVPLALPPAQGNPIRPHHLLPSPGEPPGTASLAGAPASSSELVLLPPLCPQRPRQLGSL